jgi:hypothetical protein
MGMRRWAGTDGREYSSNSGGDAVSRSGVEAEAFDEDLSGEIRGGGICVKRGKQRQRFRYGGSRGPGG